MKKTLKAMIPAALAISTIMATTAYAEPQSRPNGPYVENEQNISLSSYMSNQELYDTLKKLEESSQGKMKLEVAGYSNQTLDGYSTEDTQGDPLYLVKFGDADPNKKRILITTQIHGNEQIGTEAAIDIIQKLSSGGKEVNDILDKVSIWIMPRINPEGADNQYEGTWYPTRYTHQTWDPLKVKLPEGTEAPWYYNADGSERAQNNNGRIVYGIPGYDQNRDYNPNLDFKIEDLNKDEVADFLNNPETNNSNYGGFYVTAEARTVTSVFKEFKPDVYVDVHHRGFNTVSDEDDRSVPVQLAAVVATDSYTDPFTGKQYEVDDEALKLGKQVNALSYLTLQRGFSHFGAIQKYPDVNLPGTALGAFALNDAAIMLIEIKGQSQTLGQKQSGMLKETVKAPLYEVFKGLADGSIHTIDPQIYDDIPPSSNRISDPTTRDDQGF
ncbi:MAG TPA: M14 family zinc carboxypeptidase [Bacillus sp. (in: firmicutes)]|uniref:M14 family zinc carboxypeptidase n=1 Tax=Bacillus litorisediminis TaxID=2922713 RepID=UPI001FAFEC2F|nr:M14 family zinc carboxypeptidase [Bacillus litorisediminis]HWO75961.1 M14 family zinc carboxypeptidase [Bacillus sp. (in: firmicutes)]